MEYNIIKLRIGQLGNQIEDVGCSVFNRKS